MDTGQAEPAEVLVPGAAVDPDARRALSIDVDGSVLAVVDAALDGARRGLARRCGVRLAGREGAGFLRYGPGGFYGPHRDCAADVSWRGAARRRVSVVLFLNTARAAGPDGTFDGGELLLYMDLPDSAPRVVLPRAGLLVAFDAGTLHEVLPVTAGTRDVIVDWYYD